MTQYERWMIRYNEVIGFLKENHRNPSKYIDEERVLVNWCKHQRKIIKMKPERMKMFERLQELADKYKHVNQYH